MSFFTTADGIRLYYEVIGKGEPLLLVGGRNSDHHIWNLVRKDLLKRYQVIVYDQRGTGQSDKPEQASFYSTRIFASDAIAILDYLQILRAHAYGVSMGGTICQWLGVDYPDRIGALVIACSTAGQSHGVPPSQEIKELMAGKDSSKALGLMFSKPIGFNQLQFFYSMKESVKKQMPAYAEEFHALASREHDAWDLLPNIIAPTLILQGSDDQVCRRKNAELLAERIPNAELHIFDKGRHMFFIEFRQRVDRLIRDFLTRHSLKQV